MTWSFLSALIYKHSQTICLHISISQKQSKVYHNAHSILNQNIFFFRTRRHLINHIGILENWRILHIFRVISYFIRQYKAVFRFSSPVYLYYACLIFNFLFRMIRTHKESIVRQGSIDDINSYQFLKVSNYEETVRQLDIYYGIVKRQLLRFQSPITGLFPVLSTDTTVGSVRESIYCAAAIWSLYQAYR